MKDMTEQAAGLSWLVFLHNKKRTTAKRSHVNERLLNDCTKNDQKF